MKTTMKVDEKREAEMKQKPTQLRKMSELLDDLFCRQHNLNQSKRGEICDRCGFRKGEILGP